MNRRESMRNTRHKNTNDPQKKKYRLGTVSQNILLVGLYQNFTNDMPYVGLSGRNLEVSKMLAYSTSSPQLIKHF